jgi:hypothetical protein
VRSPHLNFCTISAHSLLSFVLIPASFLRCGLTRSTPSLPAVLIFRVSGRRLRRPASGMKGENAFVLVMVIVLTMQRARALLLLMLIMMLLLTRVQRRGGVE